MYIKQIAVLSLLAVTASAVIATHQAPEPPRPAIHPALNAPPAITAFLTRSCADCHSAHTRWPWYGYVPPVSWMLQRDVERARRSMDLSLWPERNGRTPAKAMATLVAACVDVQSGRMPRSNYLWMHSKARPKPEDVQQFCDWTREAIVDLAERQRQSQ